MKMLKIGKLSQTSAVAVIAAVGLGSGKAEAAVMTSGCVNADLSCNLQELVDGGSITIGDKLFDNWFADDFSDLSVDFSQIEVVPLDDQPLNPGLKYNANGQLSTLGLDLIDFELGFTIATLDGSSRIVNNSLEINQFSFGTNNFGGFIDISENILDESDNPLGDKLVIADNFGGFFELFDSAEFAPQPLIQVETLILISGDDDNDTVSLDMFTQRFAQEIPEEIPESSILTMLGMIIVSLGLMPRCQKGE